MTSVGDFVILGDLALWKQKKNPVKFNFKVVIVFDIIQSLYAEFSKIKKKYNTLKPKKQTKTSWTVLTGKKKKKIQALPAYPLKKWYLTSPDNS